MRTGRALLDWLEATPGLVAERFAGLSGEEATQPGPYDTFSPVEQCWHLADLEGEGFLERIRRLREETDPHLPDFDGARLARERRYRARSLAEGLAAFRRARDASLAALRSLTADEWPRAGTQEGVGRVTLRDLPSSMADHDASHRAEIEAWRLCRRTGPPVPPPPVLETDRLTLRGLTPDDAAFVLELLNEPSFLRYIGDKGVRNPGDACRYIMTGPMASYERFGFGLYLVEHKDDREPLGMCGLLKRAALEDVDIGFAFRPRFWSRGYAFEAASAVLARARDALGLTRIVAITSSDNTASIGLLAKLGFSFERMARLSATEPEVMLFASGSER